MHIGLAIRLLKAGYPSATVASEASCSPEDVQKLSELYSITPREPLCVSSTETQLENRLPELLHLAMDELERILISSRETTCNKLEAIRIITALRE